MKKILSLAVLGLLVCAGMYGDSDDKYIYTWDTDIYFGHVIYPEAKHDGKDAVVMREGQVAPEVADMNLPIAPGDTIRTSDRRCEIQFDTGTVIRLDRNTELKIETILARSLSSRNLLTNLLLSRGQLYVMYKRYIRKEIFQIITPNTAVKLDHHSVALIDSQNGEGTDIHMSQGKGYALFGPDENSVKKKAVRKSQQIMVTPDHRAIETDYKDIEDFEAWNEKLNREFTEFHEGEAVLPLPIQKLSKGIFYFAQKYSQRYGEWLWDRFLGYVWRPFLDNRSYPDGDWMPYYQGRWTSVQGQLFWVPSEPWGWIPYHLGIWMWNKKWGWVWIPGSVFSPAWVDWSFQQGYFCWRPWSVTDWYCYAVYRDGYFPYFAHLIHPDDDAFYIPGDRAESPGLPGSGATKAHQVITKEQLKKKTPPPPMPKELKGIYKRVILAMENGEGEILDALKMTPDHMLAVSQEGLNAGKIDQKVVKLTNLSQERLRELLPRVTEQDPQLQAVQTYNRNEKKALLREKVTGLIKDLKSLKSLEMQEFQMSNGVVGKRTVDNREKDSKEVVIPSVALPPGTSLQREADSFEGVVSSQDNRTRPFSGLDPDKLRVRRSSVRFRDWNPDIGEARRAGVTIRYSSRSNEVRCPELGISSRQVISGSSGNDGRPVHTTLRGSFSSVGRGGGISAGSVSSGSVQGKVSSKASSSSAEKGNNTSSTSKGGVVKKKD